MKNTLDNTLGIIVEQGQEIGKNGKVMVKVTPSENEWDIKIFETAVYVQTFNVNLNK
ncbi:hypothetical protein [Staphylococcus equorum]|uniref:hypothetical protein n=1 Tax=Staphylococcus equorum TaxID=246432 RepID=UPI003F7AD979